MMNFQHSQVFELQASDKDSDDVALVHEPVGDLEAKLARAANDETSSVEAASTHPGADKSLVPAYAIAAIASGAGTAAVAAHDALDRPEIKVRPGEMHLLQKTALQLLAHTKRYYQQGQSVVVVVAGRGADDVRIEHVDELAIVADLEQAANWTRYQKSTDSWQRIGVPDRLCRVVVKSKTAQGLNPLKGLARHPFLRPDGSLVQSAGYDEATSLYAVFDPSSFNVPETPTRDEAEAALSSLNDLLGEFPFVSPSDRSAALAAMLTACIRPSLPFAPMFHVRAHAPGTGKSMLTELVGAFATDRRASPVAFPSTGVECEKLLIAELATGPAVIEFDNLTSNIVPHKMLCFVLTREQAKGRILQSSKMVEVGTRTLILSSGNNVGPVADMTRRCVTIHLDAKCDTPAARSFKRPTLMADVHAERERYVSAALTIVRAWVVAGNPMSSCKPFVSFDAWSKWCRQPLLWLGEPDPVANVFSGMEEDPERNLLGRLLAAWERAIGSKPAGIRDLVNEARVFGGDDSELLEILEEISGDTGTLNRKILGRWVQRHEKQVVAGLRLVSTNEATNARRYRLEKVGSMT